MRNAAAVPARYRGASAAAAAAATRCSLARLPTSLTNVGFKNNSLTGTLPVLYSQLTQLRSIDLGFNQLGPCTLPEEYSAWGSAQAVWFNDNKLLGTLPAAYSSWASLQAFGVQGNALTGTLPESYSAWSQVGRRASSALGARTRRMLHQPERVLVPGAGQASAVHKRRHAEVTVPSQRPRWAALMSLATNSLARCRPLMPRSFSCTRP